MKTKQQKIEERKEKIEILTDAYKDAEEKINEALEILASAHDETDTKMDYRIEQALDSGYLGGLREEIIDRQDEEYWTEGDGKDDLGEIEEIEEEECEDCGEVKCVKLVEDELLCKGCRYDHGQDEKGEK